ncbi:hypothetical protein [Caballeronia sp.]
MTTKPVFLKVDALHRKADPMSAPISGLSRRSMIRISILSVQAEFE